MIDRILLRLKLWSFVVLPCAGFVTGQILQFSLNTRSNNKYESLVVYLVTTTLMKILYEDFHAITDEKAEHKVEDNRDRRLFLNVSNLFIMFTVLGLISTLF
jgi:hypothetical protein